VDLATLLKRKSWETAIWRVKSHGDDLRRSDLRAVWDEYWSLLAWQEKLLMRLAGSPPQPMQRASVSKAPPVIPASSASLGKKALFVTALNLEFIAVHAHLTEVRERTALGIVYAVGVFTHQGHHCEVIVALAGMGNVEASLATERAIAEFTPDYAFFIGIAGGLKEELKLGDVVVADKVYAYESGKAQKEFHSRPKAPPVSLAAIQRASAVARDRKWLNRIKPAPFREPTAYVKPIAAGEKVLDSHESEVYALLKRSYGDAYAVAMEEFGFTVAAQAHTGVTFAVVRGISDAANDKSDAEKQNSQELAARNAAAFAFEMLAGFLEADSRVNGPFSRKTDF
jgi:nucleoside phosphorylase